MTTEEILTGLLRREGGYVDHPADKGGPTNMGITQATLAAWRKGSATVADVQALTEAEARQIYRRQYVEAPGFEAVTHDGLRALLIDYYVTSWDDAIRDLQKLLGIAPDGTIGPRTRAALAAADQAALLGRMVAARQEHILDTALDAATRQFLKEHPTTQLRFLRGWLRRNLEFI